MSERLDCINERLSLIQKDGGLMFGTDAYLLSAYLKPQPNGIAAELGSGTGVISLLCAARERFKRIYTFELQAEYAELTRRNAELNSLDGCISSACRDIREVTSRDTDGEVASVFTNPPYLPTGCGFHAKNPEMDAARRELSGDIGDFAACAARLLKTGGYFTAVYRPDRLTDLLCAMRENSIEPKKCTLVYPTPSSPPSLVLVEGKKGASGFMKITPPLIIYESDGRTYTEAMRRIYGNGSFEGIFDK